MGLLNVAPKWLPISGDRLSDLCEDLADVTGSFV